MDEKKIEEGVEKGHFFEGILRSVANNRRRAFVYVNGIKVDIMIDNLLSQNRALDGDTVLIEILPPSRWAEYISTDIPKTGKTTIAKPSGSKTLKGAAGYTNETAVEQRIVDSKTLEQAEESKSSEKKELSAVKVDIRKVAAELSSSYEHIRDEEDLEDEKNQFLIDDEQRSRNSSQKRRRDNSDSSSDAEVTVTPQKPMKNPRKSTRLAQIQGSTRAERLESINKLALDLRPLGKVRAILKSPTREKELLITLMTTDKELLDLDKALEMKQQEQAMKQKVVEGKGSIGIFGAPISKKLP